MLITPVILIPVGIQVLNKAQEPPGEERLIDDQPLEGIVEEHQEEELGDTALVISLVFIVVMAGGGCGSFWPRVNTQWKRVIWAFDLVIVVEFGVIDSLVRTFCELIHPSAE